MILPLLTIPAIVCAAAAAPEPTTAVRGLAARVEVDYAPRLRARENQSSMSPVLVRVSAGESLPASRQVIEFIGAVAGDFDLRDYVERVDGRPTTDLAAIPVTVVSRLPADHGVDLYATTGSWMNWRANYRELMWGAVMLWAAVPVAVAVIRAARRARPEPAPAAAPPPPTVAEQLREALEAARSRALTIEESGRLELLLFRYLGGDRPVDGEDIARVIREFRASERTGPVVLAIEAWLHTQDGGETARARAAAALEDLRRGLTGSDRPREAVV